MFAWPQDVAVGVQGVPGYIYIPGEWMAAANAAAAHDPALVMRQYIERISPIFEPGRSPGLSEVTSALYGTARTWLAGMGNKNSPSSLDTVQPELHSTESS